MKLIKPSVEIIEQDCSIYHKMDADKYLNQNKLIDGIKKHIEFCGRTCYKSQDNIADGTADKFVNAMIKSNHGAMLEHGTVYLKVSCTDADFIVMTVFYGHNKYSKVNHSYDNRTYYITTNYRVIVENEHYDDLKHLCEPTEFHEKRVTARFILPIGISREFCRHRVFSFAEQSTRYCNFNTEKFNNELTFIKPTWYTEFDNNSDNLKDYEIPSKLFYNDCEIAEVAYNKITQMGYKPQEAREVLPLCTKSELIMTGFISDWNYFFDLRALGTTGAPHPQAKELACNLRQQFIEKGYIKE